MDKLKGLHQGGYPHHAKQSSVDNLVHFVQANNMLNIQEGHTHRTDGQNSLTQFHSHPLAQKRREKRQGSGGTGAWVSPLVGLLAKVARL